MSHRTEPQILAEVMDNVRSLTLFYLNYTVDLDKAAGFMIGNFQTNSIAWTITHLAWAEDYLILQGVGNRGLKVRWFEYFRVTAGRPDLELYPPFEESLATLHQVHTAALDLIMSMPPETLDEPNYVGRKFGSDVSRRIIIYHCIRHDGVHCGHIGWLLRMHGKKVF